MNRLLVVACFLAMLLGPGCQSSPSMAVQTFCSAPRGWITADREPFQATVGMSHLELGGSRTGFDPTPFELPRGTVALAFTGGAPDGFAGIAVWDTASTDRPYICLAVRPEGHWRVFRGTHPGTPLGGRGWQPLSDDETVGFLALTVNAGPGGVEFSLNGKPLERYDVDISSGVGPDGAGRFLVGIFCENAETRWKNFIVEDGAVGGTFASERMANWGDVDAADALLAEAVRDTKKLSERPSPMGVRRVVASLDQARRIEGANGNTARVAAIDDLTSKIQTRIASFAARIGEGDFVARAFARVLNTRGSAAVSSESSELVERAAKAEAEGHVALALCLYAASDVLGSNTSHVNEIDRLKSQLPDLQLDYSIESVPSRAIFDDRYFWQIVRESYGALRLQKGGNLAIRVKVLRSVNDADASKDTRRVPIYSKGRGRLPELIGEREGLEKELPDELAEAQARYNVMRTGSKFGGEVRTADLRTVTLGGRSYKLLVDDAEKLVQGYRRLQELEGEIADEQKIHEISYESVPATLHTNSLLVEFSTSVELDSRSLVDLERERVYLGLQQWSHPAVPRLGLAASEYSDQTIKNAIRTVAKRVLKRFRTGIVPENLLSKLDSAERIDFAVRLARKAGGREARLALEWTLKNELDLGGRSLTSVVDLVSR